jgi:endo-1,4-beta-D-glucanase Y
MLPFSTYSTEIQRRSPWYLPLARMPMGHWLFSPIGTTTTYTPKGMSYGIMIAVQLDKRAEFDALWNCTKTYMHINDPKRPSFGYFSWSCKTDGTPNEETAAPDGEEYFVRSICRDRTLGQWQRNL